MIDVIPAIDLIDGKCVRLKQGDYAQQTTYRDNPVEVAKEFEALGIKRLHLVDLDGAKIKKVVNDQVLRNITKETNLIVDFGGGIQSSEDLDKVFDAGAEMVTCGSVAIKKRALFEDWISTYGSNKIILAADVKNKQVAISGWQETTSISIFEFLDAYTKKGIEYILCTDIAKDGMLTGPSIDLYVEIQKKFPSLKVIASGGISNAEDIRDLDKANLFGTVVGKAIYEGKITPEELKSFA
ncbi:MAG: 1-(5-phosphoribosyl)-5-[(5-phosphoribosylamino)methylideneamino]imidazole-4-carboxamide isomerase [Flammeovirgaceae bacterium]|nr:1-(5-phosphoribosyl)-5-[(5-phosphoribosylamino)methylideneamino]imidazole-4-carboxamide isomerase [Flammeovirgaceae bacterium]